MKIYLNYKTKYRQYCNVLAHHSRISKWVFFRPLLSIQCLNSVCFLKKVFTKLNQTCILLLGWCSSWIELANIIWPNYIVAVDAYWPLLGVLWLHFAPDSIMWDTLVVFFTGYITRNVYQITKYLLYKLSKFMQFNNYKIND